MEHYESISVFNHCIIWAAHAFIDFGLPRHAFVNLGQPFYAFIDLRVHIDTHWLPNHSIILRMAHQP